MTAPISRTQAWCKLAVLIAEGLPAPTGVSFHTASPIMTVDLADGVALDAWCAPLGALDTRTRKHSDGSCWLHSADGDWCGWRVQLYASTPADQYEPEPITEDMSQVRAIAGASLPDSYDSCVTYSGPHPPHDGHIYDECCGKVGRLSRHKSWCKAAGAVSE